MNPLNEFFYKHGIKDESVYTINKLYEMMYDLGLVNSKRDNFVRNWFLRKIENKHIVLPEKEKGAHWRFTGHQIKRIIISFMPGGKKIYDYREEL